MILTLLIIGLLIGAILGLTGAGGSLLAMPLLLVVLKLPPTAATGLALGVVAASSLYGVIQHFSHKKILWVPAILFSISGALFAPVGRVAAAYVPDTLLLIGFSLLSLIIAARMLWQSIRKPEEALIVRAANSDAPAESLLCRFNDKQSFDWRLPCIASLAVGGLVTGLLSGFFGVGGGFLIVPFLNLLNGISMRNAVATSLVIIAVISTSGFLTHLMMQPVNWQQLAFLGIGGIAGMVLGSALAKRLAGAHLQQIFALSIIAMAVAIFFR